MTTKRILALVGGHLLLLAFFSTFLDFLPLGVKNAQPIATISLLDTMSFYFNQGGFLHALLAILFTMSGALCILVLVHALLGKKRYFPLISVVLAVISVFFFYFTLTSLFGTETSVISITRVNVLLGSGFWLALLGGLILIASGLVKDKKA